MCLLIALSQVVPGWPLVVAANRDERYDRASRPAGPLPSPVEGAPAIVGGRDEVGGGTWLAVNQRGVVVGLTNRPLPGGRDLTKRSRGELPLALAAGTSAATAVGTFSARYVPEDFNPCWLLVGDRSRLFLVDMTGPDQPRTTELASGLHVLENRAPGEPSAKVDHVRQQLAAVGTWSPAQVLATLGRVLADHTPTQIPADDSDEEQRRARLSACCIHTPEYGTRSSSLVTVGAEEGQPPVVRSSDGPSCTNRLVEVPFS